MEQVVITSVGPDAVAQLQQIGRQTFLETFAAVNTEENMQRYLAGSFSLEKLSAELKDPDAAFFFAMVGDTVAGYLKVNTGAAQTEKQVGKAMEIERIYVLKEFLGQKVGQALFEKAVALARQAGVAYVWLGVWENNLRAIQFYKKNGFVAFDKHLFRLGDDVQTDIMMQLHLAPQGAKPLL